MRKIINRAGELVEVDDDYVLQSGERNAQLRWHLVNPMLKDEHTPVAHHAVSPNDDDSASLDDAHAAYVKRLTRRTGTSSSAMADDSTSLDDAHAAYVQRLQPSSAKPQGITTDSSPDNARADWINRLTRKEVTQ